MNKFLDILIAIAMFALAYVDFRYAVPFMWKHGSSAAFSFTIGLVIVGVFIAAGGFYVLLTTDKKGKYKNGRERFDH